MTHASAWASPLVVIAQHTHGTPSKHYGSPDGLTGVKHSQTPTVRKNVGPASRGLAMRSAFSVCQAARLRIALVVLPCWLVVCWALGAGATPAASPPSPESADVWPVEASFQEAVPLWADEPFEALWERGQLCSRDRVSWGAFVQGMRHRVVKPTCCWDRLHAVQVHSYATDEALIEAHIGVDLKTLGSTVVRRMLVALRQEEGVRWITLEDFLTKPEDGLSDLRAPRK